VIDDARFGQEDALVQALADLKTATQRRRSLQAGSDELLPAVRHEREVMERINELVAKLRQTRD